jgi:hypothetical protein
MSGEDWNLEVEIKMRKLSKLRPAFGPARIGTSAVPEKDSPVAYIP